MQQIRREFGRARELLQLVYERESLRETDISIQREIFELEVSELDENDDFKLKSKIESLLPVHSPKLMFPHFLDTVCVYLYIVVVYFPIFLLPLNIYLYF
jgi:hypothetical protein